MQNKGKTTAYSVLKLACWNTLGSLLIFNGLACNKMESAARQGDRAVDEQLAKSQMDRETGGNKGRSDAFESLKKAAAESGASPVGKIRAKSELAQEEFNRASAQLPELNRRSLQIEQVLWDLRQTGSQIQATQQTSAAYALLDPKDAMAKIEEQRATIQKNIEKAKADATAAQTDLDKRQQEIDALKEDRKKAQAEADVSEAKSGGIKGDASVKLFAQASESRIKAGTLAAQIESKSAALQPIQKLVAIARQQQQFWDNAAKDAPGATQQLDERKAQLDSGWKETQIQVDTINDSAKKMATKVIVPVMEGDHPNAGGRLVKLIGDNEKHRTEIAKLLGDSVKHASEATAAAKQLHTEIQARVSESKDPAAPDLLPVKGLLAAYDANQYALQQGVAQNALADLYAGQVVELQHRKQVLDVLAKTLQAGGLTLPADLVVGDVSKSVDDAVRAYKLAEGILEPVSTATQNTDNLQLTKNSARIGLLHAHLGRYQLTRDEEAKTLFKQDQVQAKEANIDLPPTLRQNLQ